MRHKKSYAIVVTLVSLVILIASVSFSTQSQTIDIFKYLTFTFVGVDGAGALHHDIDVYSFTKKSERELAQMLQLIEYTSTKESALRNGEYITIDVDEKQPILRDSQLKLQKTKQILIVEKLPKIPEKWSDVRQKEQLIRAAEDAVLPLEYEYQKSLLFSLNEEIAEALDVTIERSVVEVWWKQTQEGKCSQNIFAEGGKCGNVAFIYQLRGNIDNSKYRLREPNRYFMVAYSGISEVDDQLSFHSYYQQHQLPYVELGEVHHILKQHQFIYQSDGLDHW